MLYLLWFVLFNFNASLSHANNDPIARSQCALYLSLPEPGQDPVETRYGLYSFRSKRPVYLPDNGSPLISDIIVNGASHTTILERQRFFTEHRSHPLARILFHFHHEIANLFPCAEYPGTIDLKKISEVFRKYIDWYAAGAITLQELDEANQSMTLIKFLQGNGIGSTINYYIELYKDDGKTIHDLIASARKVIQKYLDSSL